MSEDLVERLRHTAEWGIPDFTNSALLKEAAARIEAQETEIARLKANPPLLDVQSLPRVDALVKSLEARANQAESALANAVENNDRLRDDVRQLWNFGVDELRICEHCNAWMTIEEAARVDDVSLCPREAYGSVKFPNEKCFQHRAWIVNEEREAAREFVKEHDKP